MQIKLICPPERKCSEWVGGASPFHPAPGHRRRRVRSSARADGQERTGRSTRHKMETEHLLARTFTCVCVDDWDVLHTCAPSSKSSHLTAFFTDRSSTCLTHHLVPRTPETTHNSLLLTGIRRKPCATPPEGMLCFLAIWLDYLFLTHKRRSTQFAGAGERVASPVEAMMQASVVAGLMACCNELSFPVRSRGRTT